MKPFHHQAAAVTLAFCIFAIPAATTVRATDDASSASPPIPKIPGLEDTPPPLSKAEVAESAERAKKQSALERKQWPHWKVLILNFRALRKRSDQALTGPPAVKDKYIAELRALFEQAKELSAAWPPGFNDFQEWMTTFNTELAKFGVEAPGSYRLNNNDDVRVEPQTLVDPKTHVKYELKADGQHVVAISPKGKVLWSHHVLDDAWIAPYRFSKPVITVFQLSSDAPEDYQKHLPFSFWEREEILRPIYPAKRLDPSRRLVEVWFNSSQFGYIDTITGKFHFLGNN